MQNRSKTIVIAGGARTKPIVIAGSNGNNSSFINIDSETRGAFLVGAIIIAVGLIFEAISGASALPGKSGTTHDRRPPDVSTAENRVNPLPIDLLQDGPERLVAIRGVGETTARAIAGGRESLLKQGYSGLLDIPGIGPARQKTIMENAWLPPMRGAVCAGREGQPRHSSLSPGLNSRQKITGIVSK